MNRRKFIFSASASLCALSASLITGAFIYRRDIYDKLLKLELDESLGVKPIDVLNDNALRALVETVTPDTLCSQESLSNISQRISDYTLSVNGLWSAYKQSALFLNEFSLQEFNKNFFDLTTEKRLLCLHSFLDGFPLNPAINPSKFDSVNLSKAAFWMLANKEIVPLFRFVLPNILHSILLSPDYNKMFGLEGFVGNPNPYVLYE